MRARQIALAILTLLEISPWAQASIPQQRLVVDQADIGSDQPSAGASAFDLLVSQKVDGKVVLKVPFPFTELIKLIESKVLPPTEFSPDPTGIHKTLIPLGRSLQRVAAKPDFFLFPRVVLAVTGLPRQQGAGDLGLYLKDRLYIGYQEKAEVLEVISYNELAGRFEFEQVKDYREGGAAIVQRSQRSLCLACHQSHSPIFPQNPWDETTASAAIVQKIVAAGADRLTPGFYHGVKIDSGIKVPYEIDNSTTRASGLNLLQKLWRESCGKEPVKAQSCRRAIVQAIVQYRLSGVIEQSSRFLNDFWTSAFDFWKDQQLLVLDNHISKRNPLEELSSLRRADLSHLTGTPVKEELQKLVESSDIAAEDEPINPRPPMTEPITFEQGQPLLNMIKGFAHFFTEIDTQTIDQYLAQHPAVAPSIEAVAQCHYQTRTRPGADFSRLDLRCVDKEQTGVSFSLEGQLSVDNSGSIRGGTLESLRLLGCDTCGTLNNIQLQSAQPLVRLTDGSWALDSVTAKNKSLSVRFANADRLVGFTLKAQNDGNVVIRVIVSRESAVLEKIFNEISDKLLPGMITNPFSELAFSRSLVLPPLLRELGVKGEQSCCALSALKPDLVHGDRQSDDKEALVALAQINPAFRVFRERCSGCHINEIGFPTEFLSGDAVGNVRTYASRIYYRLSIWKVPQPQALQNHLPTGMPPKSTFVTETVDQWLQSDDYKILLDYVTSQIPADKLPTIMSTPFNKLPP